MPYPSNMNVSHSLHFHPLCVNTLIAPLRYGLRVDACRYRLGVRPVVVPPSME